MPRLAISLHPTSAPHFHRGDPERTVAIASDLGYDGIDVAVCDRSEVQRLGKLLEGSDLRVGALMTGPLWTSAGLSLSDPATTASACRCIAEISTEAANLGAAVVIGSVLGRLPTDPRLQERFRTTMSTALQRLAGHAGELGVPLLIEPMNRYESNALPTAAAAAAVASSVSPHASLVLDCFHANIEETDACDAARSAASDVGLIHLSDSHRGVPGDGHFPIDAWMAALRAGGYSGEYTIEAEFGVDAEADAGRALAFCRARGV